MNSSKYIKLFPLLIGLLLIFSFSCKENEKNHVKSVIEDKISSKINLIDSLKSYSLKGGFIERNKSKKLRIVSYIDANCSSCVFDLDRWGDYINENAFDDVDYHFYMRSYSIPQLHNFLKEVNFNYPVIVDFKNTYKNTNQLSDAKMFQTFLVDENDTVVLIGNPIYDIEISNLYLKTISNRIKN